MMNFSIFTKNLLEKSESQRTNTLSKVFESKFLTKARNKKISKPYQFFGIWIAQNLNDFENIPLYIKLAKEQDKYLLEHAVSYVSDYPEARSKKKIFLWFLKGKLKKTASQKLKKIEIALFAKPKSIKKIKVTKKEINKEEIAKTLEIDTNLSPIDTLVKALSKEFKCKFEKDYYFSIYKTDLFSEKMKLALDFTKDIKKNLAKKQYFKTKKQKLNKSGIRYLELRLSLNQNPSESDLSDLIYQIRN